MTPLTIRADTPREAVEEVCKWLEDRAQIYPLLAAKWSFPDAARVLRSATIEPKEPTNG